MKKSLLIALLCFVIPGGFFAQTTFPTNGAPFNPHSIYAFINATIFVDHETVIKNGNLLRIIIRN